MDMDINMFAEIQSSQVEFSKLSLVRHNHERRAAFLSVLCLKRYVVIEMKRVIEVKRVLKVKHVLVSRSLA